MDLINKLYLLYEQIGEKILNELQDKVRINIEKQVNRHNGSFTITLEIFNLDKILDDDYGLVFATNAQIESHFSYNNVNNNGGLFIISDLSSGNGEEIDSTEEFIFFPHDTHSLNVTFDKIKQFVQILTPSIYNIFIERYR
jgi:hypothetical protein